MQCILCKIYFWKVFHMNYNWICTPICTKILFLQKVGVTNDMYEELENFERNQVWTLVDPPHGVNVIDTKWVLKNK
jgi:hypothetical protein